MTQPPHADVLDPTTGDDPIYEPPASHGGTPVYGDLDPYAGVSYPETDPETDGDSSTGSETGQETATDGRRKPSKAEIETAASLAVDNSRRARRRRRRIGYAMAGLIVMAAAASAVGWPIVLTAAAVVGGTTAVGAGVTRTHRDPARQAARQTSRAARQANRVSRRGRTSGHGGATGRLRRSSATTGLFGRRAATAGGRANRSAAPAGRKRATGAASTGILGRKRATGASTGGGILGRKRAGASTGGGILGRRRSATSPAGRTSRSAHPGGSTRRGTAPHTARQAKREAIRQARIARKRAAVDRKARIREARRARRWARSDRRRDARQKRVDQRRNARARWQEKRRQARWERRDKRRDARWERHDQRAENNRRWRRRMVKRHVLRPVRRGWRNLRSTQLLAWLTERATFIERLAHLQTEAAARADKKAKKVKAQTAAAPAPVLAPAQAPPAPVSDRETRAATAVEVEAAIEAAEAVRPRRPRTQVQPPTRPGYLAQPFQAPAATAAASPTRQTITPPRGNPIMSGTGAGDGALHPAMEAVIEALYDQIGRWEVPDDGTGVHDTDLFFGSFGPLLNAVADVVEDRAEYMASETPVAPAATDTLAEFATGLRNMAADAAEVYEAWSTNEDNEHDLRRANGEVQGAEKFNVHA